MSVRQILKVYRSATAEWCVVCVLFWLPKSRRSAGRYRCPLARDRCNNHRVLSAFDDCRWIDDALPVVGQFCLNLEFYDLESESLLTVLAQTQPAQRNTD